MSRLKVATIVEGHGEVQAVPILLRRIWYDVIAAEFIEVLRPIREKRHRLATNKDDALTQAVRLAAMKLRDPSLADDPALILILIDANSDLPCQLAPTMLQIAEQHQSDQDIVCVLAVVEFESWFVAAAESLEKHVDLDGLELPIDPEATRSGKGWVAGRFRGTKYSPSVDQPKLTAALDLSICRQNSHSFDKLCRELESRAP